MHSRLAGSSARTGTAIRSGIRLRSSTTSSGTDSRSRRTSCFPDGRPTRALGGHWAPSTYRWGSDATADPYFLSLRLLSGQRTRSRGGVVHLIWPGGEVLLDLQFGRCRGSTGSEPAKLYSKLCRPLS